MIIHPIVKNKFLVAVEPTHHPSRKAWQTFFFESQSSTANVIENSASRGLSSRRKLHSLSGVVPDNHSRMPAQRFSQGGVQRRTSVVRESLLVAFSTQTE